MTSSNTLDLNNRLKSYGETLSKWLNESLHASPRNIRLGIWGTTGAGKTTYLAMLFDALEASDNWQVTVDSKGRSFVKNYLNTINYKRKFPEPTEPGELEIYSYILSPKSSRVANSEIVLNFIDAPGEFYENILNSRAKVLSHNAQALENKKQLMDIVDYLISCDGIIFLLDPIRSKKDVKAYSELLRDLFQEFQERSPHIGSKSKLLEQYMAFCVTKVDREELWNKGQKSDELAEDVMSWELKRLKNYCWLELDREKRKNRIGKENRCEFFSVSSIGRSQDKDGKWQPSVIYPAEKSNSNQQANTPIVASQPQQIKRGFDFDDYTSSQTTNINLSSSSSSDDWVSSNNKENKPALSPKLQPTIKPDITLNSHNVLEPIEWLIRGIQKHPPSRPKLSSLPNQNS
ncbi:TRAFAC clade GTPase domain-containing protein [Nostoc sp. DedSLP04]|uniref:TRAFAC clade GTPase domain-containing protein n=1 Tax=Nostoc sp. DedSLP04 TaxID=3075401 RepID=UPI002AD59C4A|nr:hypothetical protein [Nostoc sp. DedSLP04]MDZ8034953.1 hypothetical protein [Nostoc sp. DedSLP04]